MAGLRVLVCVTGQKTCERLIQEGAEIARELDGTVSVVHVAGQRTVLGSAQEGEALEYLFRTADEHGADMAVLRADGALDAMDVLVQYALAQEADCIVVGMAQGKAGGSFAEQLRARLPSVEVRSVYAS